MKRLAFKSLVWLTAVVIAGGCAGAQKAAPAVPDSSGLPPLIDRNLFFGDPEISGAQVSPDGTMISFIKPYKGARNIWVKGRDEPFEKARPVTADKRPVPGYFWSRDSRYILYVQDKGGNENFHVYAVDPKAGAEKDTGVPPARDLTPVEGVRAMIYSVPKGKPDVIMVGLNDRDKAYHDVYRVTISSGKRELVIRNTAKVAGWQFDLDGNPRLALRQKEDAGWEILRIEGKEFKPIYECDWQESCFPYRFHKDGRHCYLISNKGTDLAGLVLLDVETGKAEPVEYDPEKQVDFGGALFAEDTDELEATFYVGDRQRIYPRTDRMKKILSDLRRQLPDGELGVSSASLDMRNIVVGLSRDVDPGSTWLYDSSAGKATLLYRSRPELNPDWLAPMKPVRYRARDGLEIPAYLTLPKGVEPRNLPVVIFPHGGPWARDTWGYDPYAQFLANRGYAVLQPNFRGSTGYGKKFLNAGNRQWGTGAMQHDITDGVKWLIEQGIADPSRVCIFGGSYGGYATLAGVTFTPGLYRCGIAYVAPSNLITLLESIPPYWKPLVKMFHKRVGNPEVEADRKDLMSRSPLNFVDRIRAPLLVVHGANDPRVKQAEADSIVAVLHKKGLAVEYIVAPDEGHGFRAPENRLALAVAMERFLAKHLGGRVQKEVRPEIAKRLEQITVDPATVKMPDRHMKALAEQVMTRALPSTDASVIEPAKLRYSGRVEVAGRKLDISVERVISKDEATGTITVESKVKMGPSERSDRAVLDGKTLALKSLTMGEQLELQVADGRITGEFRMGGNSMKIDKQVKGDFFGEGAALEVVLAALPVAEGYTTGLRVLSLLEQKVLPYSMEVGASGKTKVKSGTFDTFEVKIQRLDGTPGGGTAWLMAASPHWPVKASWKLPAAAGGGTIELELTGIERKK